MDANAQPTASPLAPRNGRRTLGKVLRKLMALVGLLTFATVACLSAFVFLSSHLVADDEGRVVYCKEVGLTFADSFDNDGNWLSGQHIWTCDGREVRIDEFTSEAADLGLR